MYIWLLNMKYVSLFNVLQDVKKGPRPSDCALKSIAKQFVEF